VVYLTALSSICQNSQTKVFAKKIIKKGKTTSNQG
jgi:hypothetical protein